MGSVKQDAIDMFAALPDDCTLEDIHYHLYVLGKVLRGLQAVDGGRTVPQAEAERRVREWSARQEPDTA